MSVYRNNSPRLNTLVAVLALFCFRGESALTAETTSSPLNVPTLMETLQWLMGASEAESGDGNNHISFESNAELSCSVIITETRVQAGPNFWIKMAFSLSDIDPEDIQVTNLAEGKYAMFPRQFAVRFHTTNYADKLIHTSSSHAEPIKASEYIVFTNDWFAPKFVRAFKHAVELCGGKRSSF
jgi:hypothetical protein